LEQTKVLADRVYTGEGLAAESLRILAANVLLALCAQVAIPVPWSPAPITGQTFGVLLIAVLLGSRRSGVALLLYLLEGVSGLPVFQPFGMPGPARFFGPTSGYLLAFPPAAFLTGWIFERGGQSLRRLAGALISGDAVILLSGCVWLAAESSAGFAAAFRMGVLPFIPGELIKMAMIVAAVRGFEFVRRKA
jgi:biotin transport system substrate-specific component